MGIVDSQEQYDERTARPFLSLLWAATLCASFRLGEEHADNLWDVDKHHRLWRPGCGR